MLSFIVLSRLAKLRALPFGDLLAFAPREPDATCDADRGGGTRDKTLASRSPTSLEETLRRRLGGSSRIESVQSALAVHDKVLQGKPAAKRVLYPTELDLRCLRRDPLS
jgi:hypothetical protein